MKKSGVVLILCLFLMFTQTVLGCWAYLSVEELIERSDTIIVGEIVGKSFFPIKTDRSYNYTKWKVKVNYILEGEITEKMIYVGTPDNYTSAHYELTLWGDRVILFLRKEGNYYYTHTPQAIVGVELSEGLEDLPDKISGDNLLALIEINSRGIEAEQQVALEEYISSLRTISVIDERKGLGTSSIILAIIILTTLVGMVAHYKWFRR